MALLHETCIVGGTVVELRLETAGRYRLRYGDLVKYENGEKIVLGRRSPYEFRSVEQLRYDFERDVAAAGGRLG